MLQRVRDDGNEGVIVALSGGKDSLACLDLSASIFPRVEAFFCYIIPGLECELKTIRRCEQRYGITVRQLPSPALAGYLSAGYMTKRPSILRRAWKWKDVEDRVRFLTGLSTVVYGHRMTESLQRRGMLKNDRGYLPQYGKVYPLWDWNSAEVHSYLRARKIEFPENYGVWDTIGTGLVYESLVYIKEHYPHDYQKIIRLFPFAETKILREKIIESEERGGTDPLPDKVGSGHGPPLED